MGLHPFDMIAIRANPRGGPLQAGVEQHAPLGEDRRAALEEFER
jgi:hypothetical protein